MKSWSGSRAEAEGQMAKDRGSRIPARGLQRTSDAAKAAFLLRAHRVCVDFGAGRPAFAGLTEITADIDTTLAPWTPPKSTVTRPTPLFQQSPSACREAFASEKFERRW